MPTVELCFETAASEQERLIAALAGRGFHGFRQSDRALKAYTDAARWSSERRERLVGELRTSGLPPFEAREIADENWNARWEASIEPVAAGPFLIKPSWTDAPPAHTDKTALEIDPKMSFGTGQHASTRLALRLLADVARPGDRVLDAGAGTGILAIAAARLGAAPVLAFDTDPRTEQNARENIRRNGVGDQVTFRVGALSGVPETGFDLVLANIRRAVLIELLPAFAEKLNADGRVVLSGLMREGRDVMLEAAAAHRFQVVAERTEEDWWAVALRAGERERG
jgi:ribosomal protein L11 methyltransferase